MENQIEILCGRPLAQVPRYLSEDIDHVTQVKRGTEVLR